MELGRIGTACGLNGLKCEVKCGLTGNGMELGSDWD